MEHDPGNKSHLFPPALEEEFSQNRLSDLKMCQMAFSDSRKLLRKSREMTCLDFSHEFGSCFRLTHGQTPNPLKNWPSRHEVSQRSRSARKWLRKSGMVGNSHEPGSTWMSQVVVTLSRLKLLYVFQNLPGF